MLANGATRRQVADVVGVTEKTIYKYFPVGDRAIQGSAYALAQRVESQE
jgi:transcription initiation factor TFIIIB Brf1 subunit/transcription initiation factor TFIIB